MRALDDILIGFFIFFTVDRAVRLFSSAVIERRLKKRGLDKESVENWKLFGEMCILLSCILLVLKFQKPLSQLNKS
jgi:hypothetical protein